MKRLLGHFVAGRVARRAFRGAVTAGIISPLMFGSVLAAAQTQRFSAYPTFPAATDTVSLNRWATENLINGSAWSIDDRWAVYALAGTMVRTTICPRHHQTDTT